MYLSDMYSVFLYFELSLSIRELRPQIPLLDYAKKDTLQKKKEKIDKEMFYKLLLNNFPNIIMILLIIIYFYIAPTPVVSKRFQRY